jgi:hypothetical protein
MLTLHPPKVIPDKSPALMGHAMPEEGFGHESRITPGYAQATWEAMVRAVESLEYPASEITVFGRQSGKSRKNLPKTVLN